jgi:hypothetical protein
LPRLVSCSFKTITRELEVYSMYCYVYYYATSDYTSFVQTKPSGESLNILSIFMPIYGNL